MVIASCCEASAAIYQQTRRQDLSCLKRLDCLDHEDGGKKHPWNVGKLLTKDTASCPRRCGCISVKYIVTTGFTVVLLCLIARTWIGKRQSYHFTCFNASNCGLIYELGVEMAVQALCCSCCYLVTAGSSVLEMAADVWKCYCFSFRYFVVWVCVWRMYTSAYIRKFWACSFFRVICYHHIQKTSTPRKFIFSQFVFIASVLSRLFLVTLSSCWEQWPVKLCFIITVNSVTAFLYV